ncbi:hypothetical protein ElyMa_002512100 [Elysia marginata]|uniref:Uncharacterized protein n=1 Tax=Elysia marginata TaxID=1093978 RepID=A0AAV4GV21_9GAST|nr:hypothetical protein ElyMa_002512100 [Elysia marginata]
MLLFIATVFFVASQHCAVTGSHASPQARNECGIVTLSASSPASHYGTLTPLYGNETIWAEYVTTGASCSTEGGTFANLETAFWTHTDAKYRCKCMGAWEYTQTRTCTLHIWRCPIHLRASTTDHVMPLGA